ncbi:uncharacterized protein LOC143594820 [Bidens hawaiensis]|uniref:uncharacterized protein LOC143594820 n=1 Tax=Bidens hawaiensis TaxID=980011 RepID=UPI004049175F
MTTKLYNFVTNKSVWEEFFVSVEEWRGQTINVERIAWLKVHGVPLTLSCAKVFDEIASRFGSVIQTAQFTEDDGDLSFACVGVLRSSVDRVNQKINQKWKTNILEVVWFIMLILAKELLVIEKHRSYLCIHGILKDDGKAFSVVNVYAPQKLRDKRALWAELESIISRNHSFWVVGGDFNCVRDRSERRNSKFNAQVSNEFNEFIDKVDLQEFVLRGRKFTFVSDNKCSHIDRIFVSWNFLNEWTNAEYRALSREESDHCPLVLKIEARNFGPKPFRFFNSWLSRADLHEVVNKALLVFDEIGPLDVLLLHKFKRIKDKETTARVGRNQKERYSAKIECYGIKWLTEEDSQELVVQFSEKEIKEAVFDCGCDKAPGPNGFNFRFVKMFWPLLADDFVKIMQNFFDTGTINRGVGLSFITLIPKVKDTVGLNEYRSITLIGVISKVISKVLANRLKKVMGSIVRETQSEGVMEGLSSMIRKACSHGMFNGVCFNIDGPMISHLLYADDAMIMGEWSQRNFKALKRILCIFHLCSRLRINLHKSSLFGIGKSVEEVRIIANGLGCRPGSFPFKYLGILVGANMNRVSNWDSVVEVFKRRLSSSKEALLRKVVDAVHGSKRRWKSFRCSSRFPGTWSRLVKVGVRLKVNGIGFTNMIRGVVGDGSSIKFWIDPWLTTEPLKTKFPSLSRLEDQKGCTVAERFCVHNLHCTIQWRWKKYPATSIEVEEVIHCHSLVSNVLLTGSEDSWAWNKGSNEGYSVKEARKWLKSNELSEGNMVFNWCKWIPNKCNIFMWRLSLDRLPTQSALMRRNINVGDGLCAFCGETNETVDHLFSGCMVVCRVWNAITSWCKIPRFFVFSVLDVLQIINHMAESEKKKEVVYGIIVIACWRIWKARNEKVFNGADSNVVQIISDVKSMGYLCYMM